MVGSLSAGGAERVALELAAGLKERGWRTELLALAGREGANPYAEPLRAEAAARGVLVRRLSLPGIRSGPERGRVLQFLGDQDVSLVHAHNRPGDWQMTLLGRLAGVPVVYSRHLPYAGLSREQRIAYFLSARSAYVDGQVAHVAAPVGQPREPGEVDDPRAEEQPLAESCLSTLSRTP